MEFDEKKDEENKIVHVHLFNRHIPHFFSYFFLIILIFLFSLVFYFYLENKESPTILLPGMNKEKEDLVFGAWPALEDADFFNKTKQSFIDQRVTFLEANLSTMELRYYKNGQIEKEAPIATKGREGSWWETPAGLYQIGFKSKNHFSTFGQVYMPYSMQFQGNFFIHGPTHYLDGSPTPSSYSGGCIRVNLDDMKEFYELVQTGTPLLVYKDSFFQKKEINYKNKKILPNDATYLVADLENNFVFVENNSSSQKSIASITKLITALVAVEYINVEKEVFINDTMIASTSIPRLEQGESVSVLDLLSLLLRESSNEAALAVLEPLGKENFIDLMNQKADAIGMLESSFVDTSGVLSGNISTAQDLFQLAKYLYYNRKFVLDMTMGKENRLAYRASKYTNLENFNDIETIEGEIGGKTGRSSSAGDSMLAIIDLQFNFHKRPVVFVVLGSDDAKRDVETLKNYVSSNFVLEEKMSLLQENKR